MNTMQQEFDAVVNHLYTQGRPARNGRVCRYRLEDGERTLSCAVGCRIPDGKYDAKMDDQNYMNGSSTFGRVMEYFGSQLPPEFAEYKDMYRALQVAHDDMHHKSTAFDFPYLKISLELVAEDFGLTFNEPERK